MQNNLFWPIVTNDPEGPGWYPVLKCYDIEEGFFPDADFFDGTDWKSINTVAFICKRMPDKDSAKEFAYENDPN